MFLLRKKIVCPIRKFCREESTFQGKELNSKSLFGQKAVTWGDVSLPAINRSVRHTRNAVFFPLLNIFFNTEFFLIYLKDSSAVFRTFIVLVKTSREVKQHPKIANYRTFWWATLNEMHVQDKTCVVKLEVRSLKHFMQLFIIPVYLAEINDLFFFRFPVQGTKIFLQIQITLLFINILLFFPVC